MVYFFWFTKSGILSDKTTVSVHSSIQYKSLVNQASKALSECPLGLDTWGVDDRVPES